MHALTKQSALTLLSIILLMTGGGAVAEDIGGAKQLLIDDHIIHSLGGARRVFKRGEIVGPLLAASAAWEEKRSLAYPQLAKVPLPVIDRLEMDALLKEWETCDEQNSLVDEEIGTRASRSVPDSVLSPTQILMTTPGVSCYSGLTLASRIGPIERFPRPRSLANYFGLTPGCRNSGNAQDRLGSITKQKSKTARFILGQLVVHILKHDPKMRNWYRSIRKANDKMKQREM